MDKHMWIHYGDLLGLGEFSRSITVGDKLLTPDIVEACSESFTTEHGTYHYQAEYRKEAFDYLTSIGVKIPVNN